MQTFPRGDVQRNSSVFKVTAPFSSLDEVNSRRKRATNVAGEGKYQVLSRPPSPPSSSLLRTPLQGVTVAYCKTALIAHCPTSKRQIPNPPFELSRLYFTVSRTRVKASIEMHRARSYLTGNRSV